VLPDQAGRSSVKFCPQGPQVMGPASYTEREAAPVGDQGRVDLRHLGGIRGGGNLGDLGD